MTSSRTEHGFWLLEAAIALVVFGILALVSLQQYRIQETLQKAQRDRKSVVEGKSVG